MGNQKVKIAVLGSCATRDNFNSKFNENYKDFYECVLTQNQSSIISIVSDPTEYSDDKIGELTDYEKWNVRTDFTNEFLDMLRKEEPDYLIMDFFADIHFGCLALDTEKYITNNRWMLWKTKFYKESLKKNEAVQELKIEKNTELYFQKWKASVDALFVFLEKEVPNCTVIVHKARNADKYLTKDGVKDLATSGKVMNMDVQRMNNFWERLDQYIIDHYNVKEIDLTDKQYISFEDHPWGPFYVHYTMDYYRDFFRELHKIVLNDHLQGKPFYHQIFVEINRNGERQIHKNIPEYKLEQKEKEWASSNDKLQKKVNQLENEKPIQFAKRKLRKVKFARDIYALLKK